MFLNLSRSVRQRHSDSRSGRLLSRRLAGVVPALSSRGLLLLSLLLFPLLTALVGCSRGESPAFAEARELERKVLMRGGELRYTHADYLQVARLLEQVPPWSSDYDRAQEKLELIKNARRLQASETLQLAYLPEALQGVSLASLAPEQLDRNRAPAERPAAAPAQDLPAVSVEGGVPVPGGGVDTGSPRSSAPAGATVVAKHAPVILYTTSWCGYCKRARAYFTQNNVPFVDKDIERDADAAREMTQKVGPNSGVPVIDIDGTIIRGFDTQRIAAALAARQKKG